MAVTDETRAAGDQARRYLSGLSPDRNRRIASFIRERKSALPAAHQRAAEDVARWFEQRGGVAQRPDPDSS